MKPAAAFFAVAAAIACGFALAPQAAQAESLRCEAGTVTEGDSRLSLLFKCGQPIARDAYCAPVFYGDTLYPVPPPFVGTVVPCLQSEEWLYDRGPGNLMATVRLRSGKVQAIVYGRVPR